MVPYDNSLELLNITPIHNIGSENSITLRLINEPKYNLSLHHSYITTPTYNTPTGIRTRKKLADPAPHL